MWDGFNVGAAVNVDQPVFGDDGFKHLMPASVLAIRVGADNHHLLA
jgi:hypothetical protein